jgi:serine/threonine protein kinase
LGEVVFENGQNELDGTGKRNDQARDPPQRSRTVPFGVSFPHSNRRMKINIRHFEPHKIIGRGAFGEVRVCRKAKSGDVVAIKKMKKTEMIYKNQVNHVKAERDIMVQS